MGLSKPLLLFCLVLFAFEVSSFQLETRQDTLAVTSKNGDSSSTGEKALYARLTTADAKQWVTSSFDFSDEIETTTETKPDLSDDDTTLETKPSLSDSSDVQIYSTEKDGVLYTTINTYKNLPAPELNFIGDLDTCKDDHGKKMDLTISLGESATEFIKENSKDLLIYMAASCDLSDSSDSDSGFPTKPDFSESSESSESSDSSDSSDSDYKPFPKPDFSDSDYKPLSKPDLSESSDEDFPVKPAQSDESESSDEDFPVKPAQSDESESSDEDYTFPAKPAQSDESESSDEDYTFPAKPAQSDESESSDEDYEFPSKPAQSDESESSDSSDEDSKSDGKSFLDKPNN